MIWRGKLVYDGQRSLVVWAKVRISVDRDVFLAARDIPKGAVIRADQVDDHSHAGNSRCSNLAEVCPW